MAQMSGLPTVGSVPQRGVGWGRGTGGSNLQSTGPQGLNLCCQAVFKSLDIVFKIKGGRSPPLGTRTRHLSKLMTPKQQGTTAIDQSALHPPPPHHKPPFRTPQALKTPSRGLPFPQSQAPSRHPHTHSQRMPEAAVCLGREAGTCSHSFSEQMFEENLARGQELSRVLGTEGRIHQIKKTAEHCLTLLLDPCA